MDVTSIVGIILGTVCLVTAFVLEGGHITALFAPTAAMIVFGGTIGATITNFPKSDLLAAVKMTRMLLFLKLPNEVDLIEQIVQLAEKARREGILYLENMMEQLEDPFMRKGVQLIVDGTDPELVRNILETEIYTLQERQEAGAGVFEAAGGYAPTMGIIGTVMGLVHVLSNLSEPERLGPSIAMAFIATLYGVSSANIVWLPIAGKLKNLSKKESRVRELMLEGLISLQAGNNPILIRERLTAFLDPKRREKGGRAGGRADEEE